MFTIYTHYAASEQIIAYSALPSAATLPWMPQHILTFHLNILFISSALSVPALPVYRGEVRFPISWPSLDGWRRPAALFRRPTDGQRLYRSTVPKGGRWSAERKLYVFPALPVEIIFLEKVQAADGCFGVSDCSVRLSRGLHRLLLCWPCFRSIKLWRYFG